MNAAKQRFLKNEQTLERLAREGRYWSKASENQIARELSPLAARLEAQQNWLEELI